MKGFRYTESPQGQRHDWRNLCRLVPYLWEFRVRVLMALSCLVLAKLATLGVPLSLKALIDQLQGSSRELVLPLSLLLAYGALKLTTVLFNELRDGLFARVRHRAMRRLTTRTLAHLHQLSLRFHLERKTGAISRDLERGARSLSTLLNYLTFSTLPLLVELGLVITLLVSRYAISFTIVIVLSIIIYVVFTISVSDWRIQYRHSMNRLESQANNQAIESLINYETVKYFSNEQFEIARCDSTLAQWEQQAVLSNSSMALLNFGQGAIAALAITVLTTLAAQQVVAGQMTLGDLVLVNSVLLQLFIPLNFLGVVYRQTKHALADMEQLVNLLEQTPEVADSPNAQALQICNGEIQFEQVEFAYQAERRILHKISFSIPAGKKIAIVGPSGGGKSTLARLLLRFYEVNTGRILIDGQDIRQITQHSLRSAIGVVPQDTVLFNETLEYNLRYARPDATQAEIEAVVQLAQLDQFIASLPQGYATLVGERGLKLSGGEKQRVAIARALLKKPRILIFDEATSALDSLSERAILTALQQAAAGHTTLVIAHRLSTIVDADQILLLDQGRIVEQGTHTQLLALNGQYAQLWALQQTEPADSDNQ